MRFERVQGQGPDAAFRMFDGDAYLGEIGDGSVTLTGFGSREDAAEAAHVAYRALERRRARTPWGGAMEGYYVWEANDGPRVIERSGLIARLVPPDPDLGREDWGFALSLLPEERTSVFAMSRARTLWQSLRWSGLHGRMRQFRTSPPADPARDLEWLVR